MGVSFEFDLKKFGADVASVRKNTTGSQLGNAALAGILLIREFIKFNIQARGLVDTAALLNRWVFGLEKTSGTSVGAFTGTDKIYARIHEFGGVITPKTAKALHFQIDGHWVTTRSVTMPARPYVRPALDENKPEVANAIIGVLQGQVDHGR